MIRHHRHEPRVAASAGLLGILGLLLVSWSCSGSSGASSTRTQDDFKVEFVSVASMETWKLNRPIDVMFNRAVNFDTVSSNTINIATTDGAVATGAFSLLSDGKTVRFVPTCPTLGDSSDAGLKPGGIQYRLHVLGSSSGGLTVRAADGGVVETGFSVEFMTPDTSDPDELFLDLVAGPPDAIVRGRNGVALDDPDASYLEIGGDPDNREYFVWDSANQKGELEDDEFLLPLNLYSESMSQVAVVLFIDQPVNPSTDNVSTNLLALEYERSPGSWNQIGTRLTLLENCTDAGSAVRLEPIGVLPQGSPVRAVIREGFGDLAGDMTLLDIVNFANMATATAYDPGTQIPGDAVDELLEPFLNDDLEDKAAAFATPPAEWGSGLLEASFPFGGNGGPNGNFDWYIPPGVELQLNTVSTSISGGPGGSNSSTQTVVNGVVNIRDLFVPASSAIRIIGPNPCTILATGSVRIAGEITIDGSSNRGVGTLGTANLPEVGATGNGGGGRGGTGSFLTTQSTPRGGNGTGPFGLTIGGGQGGETCYAVGGKNLRRGAGGGGGALGHDVYYIFDERPGELVLCQEQLGLDGENGFGGGRPPGRGAVSQSERAKGGQLGSLPFFDETDQNDFFGKMITAEGDLVIGELDRVWAGGGSGAGGDAVTSTSFPLVPFVATGDEKGAGGAGGAGGLRILALGSITLVEPTGRITARGGQGGGGENTIFFDRAGGGSGGGSGGHIVLSSASHITIEGQAEGAGDWYNDPDDEVHEQRWINARGGQGAAGRDDFGGSTGNGKITDWRCDAIRDEVFLPDDGSMGSSAFNPPKGLSFCWTTDDLPDLGDDPGHEPVNGAGGDGTPGIIQFHVDDPATNMRFPAIPGVYGVAGAGGIDVSKVIMPPPVGWKAPELNEASDLMVPFFGKESTSQSRWIALGLARVNPSGGNDQVRFRFEGTDTDDGVIERDGEAQAILAPILGPAVLTDPPRTPYLEDDLTVVLDAASLVGDDDAYKRNPSLLKNFVVRLVDAAAADQMQEHLVASASWDAAADQLHVTVFPAGSDDLTDFGASGGVEVSLIPFFTRMNTSGEPLAYPLDSSVTISFEATVADVEGNPDNTSIVGPVTDINDLNDVDYDFFRFRVHMNMSVSGNSVDQNTKRPGIEFLRVPFRF